MSSPNPLQLAAQIRAAITSNLAGLQACICYGTIAAIPPTSNPNTVNVYLNNNASGAQPSTANNVPYLSDYTPQVGDAVLMLFGTAASQTSYVVIGPLAGSSSGGGSSGVPVGAILMFPATISYPNWLLCNGSTFSATTYPNLNTFLGGNTLPDLQDLLPMGANSIVALGATAGAQTSSALLSHTHAGPSHTHTGPSHTHTDSGHTHSHDHSPDGSPTNFIATPGSNVPVGTGGSSWASPSVTSTDSTSGSANLNNGGTGATGSASGTTGSAGSGSSFSVLNPVLGVAYYIKAA